MPFCCIFLFRLQPPGYFLVGIVHAPTFSRASTHLLCPSKQGAKFDKALEWGTPVIDLTWLEEMARTGVIPSVADHLIAGTVKDPKGKGKAKEIIEMMDITNGQSQARILWSLVLISLQISNILCPLRLPQRPLPQSVRYQQHANWYHQKRTARLKHLARLKFFYMAIMLRRPPRPQHLLPAVDRQQYLALLQSPHRQPLAYQCYTLITSRTRARTLTLL